MLGRTPNSAVNQGLIKDRPKDHATEVSLSYRITVNDIDRQHKMYLGPASEKGDRVWGILLSNRDPVLYENLFGNTLAHELGHVLGLDHRDFPELNPGDLLGKPDNLNIMDSQIPIVDDFDLIQLLAIQHSTALHNRVD